MDILQNQIILFNLLISSTTGTDTALPANLYNALSQSFGNL